MTISTPLENGWVLRTYIGFLPSEKEMLDKGWNFSTMGAEGPYYRKVVDNEIYSLQIVQQGPDNPSVININNKIEGHHQNCHIVHVNNSKEKFKTLYFGHIDTIEDLDEICEIIGINNQKVV